MTQEEFENYRKGILRGSAIHLITWIDYHAAPDKMCLSNEECKNIVDALVEGDWGKIYQYMKKKLEASDSTGESASTDDTFFDDYRKTDGEYDEVHISEHDQKSVHLQFTAEGRNISDFSISRIDALILAHSIILCLTDSEDTGVLRQFIAALKKQKRKERYSPTSIGHNEGVNTPWKKSPFSEKPITVNVDDKPDNPVEAYAKGVEEAKNEMIESMPTDKAEPKFKVGDWITDGYLHCKISDVLDDRYIVDTKFAKRSAIPFKCESNYHLWTIQDAKDGDVLAGSKGDVILMFRGIGNTEWNDVIDYHCYYDCYRKNFILQDDVDHWGDIKNNQLKPATKEQRDTLMKAMAEAGYEWDAEKKEPKLLVTNGGDFESTLTDEEVQKLHDHLEMHKQLPKSEPQAVTFIDSGTMQVIDKLNEIIGKLGDLYEVLSKPYVFPYRDYPPQGPWYKTHGVERVTPVTCETLSTMLNVPHVSGTKGKKSPFNSEEKDNEK